MTRCLICEDAIPDTRYLCKTHWAGLPMTLKQEIYHQRRRIHLGHADAPERLQDALDQAVTAQRH